MTSPQEKFKSNSIMIFEILEDMYQEAYENGLIKIQPFLIKLAKTFLEGRDSSVLVEKFLETYEFWDQIKDKNTKFFITMGDSYFSKAKEDGIKIKNSIVANSLDLDQLDIVGELIKGEYKHNGETIKILDEEREEDLWNGIHALVVTSVKYVHMKREMVINDGKKRYTQKFLPEIDMKKCVEDFNIKSLD